MITTDELRVLHLDHSRELGGAEIALRRLVANARGLWDARIAVPRHHKLDNPNPESKDPFTEVEAWTVEVGAHQKAGAARANVVDALAFGTSILGYSATLAISKAWMGCGVVHANTTRSGMYGTIAATITPRPVVIHLRDRIESDAIGQTATWLFQKFILPRASAVISNSQSTLDTALPHVKSSAIARVIPSPAGVSAAALRDLPRDEEVVNIGMVARIDPWKGQDMLLRAVASMRALRSVRVHLAGSAAFGNIAYLRELERLVNELEIQDVVTFHGHVEDVPKFIRRMNICVQASTRPEPLGQNVLQYLANGSCVVASNRGGPTEWIDDGVNGLLFQEGDPMELAEKLDLLTTTPLLREKLAAKALVHRPIPTDLEVARRHAEVFSATDVAWRV